MPTLRKTPPRPTGRRPAIRPFQPGDAAAVADVYEQVIRSGRPVAPPGLAADFQRLLLDAPGVDPEIPSLVYEDRQGNVAGFLGVYVRRMLFDGRPVRMACSGQLVTTPQVRGQAAGMFLLKHFLGGSQDLSLTDGATEEVRRMWEGLGGQTALVHCLRWTRLLRPARFTGDYLSRRAMLRPWMAACRPWLALADVAARGLARYAARLPDPGVEQHELTPEAMAAAGPGIAARRRLRPDFEPAALAWLLDQMARVRARGPLVGRLVRTAGGQVAGWYLYYLTPERIAEVVQVVADRQVELVLDCLLADADRRGALAVQGRVESGLAEPLAHRRCWLQYRAPLALVHSRHSPLLAAVQGGQALLTRAEGEWWTGFHLEPPVV